MSLVQARVDGDLRAWAEREGQKWTRAIDAGVTETTDSLKTDLRNRVRAAGLGERLPNTIRGKVYRKPGKPTRGLVYANRGKNRGQRTPGHPGSAATILAAFAHGATIRPVNGSQYLWIPTKEVPRIGKYRMTPGEVEERFRQDFRIIRAKNGRLLAVVDVVAGKNKRGYRAPTAKRLAQGRTTAIVVMFTLVREAHIPKRLDFDTPRVKAERDLAANVAKAYSERVNVG